MAFLSRRSGPRRVGSGVASGRARFFALASRGLPLALMLVAALVPASAAAQPERRPLLLTGKQSLYQRVLSRPGATLVARPHAGATVIESALAPFTVFYVYARQQEAGQDWVQVGGDSFGGIAGWLRGEQVLEWKQSLTVAFKEPLGRDRVLLFGDRGSLKSLIDRHDVVAYHRLTREAERGALAVDSPVVAIQPRAHVDIQQDFYLVPILGHEQVFLGAEPALLLQVASVPLVGSSASTPVAETSAPAPPASAGGSGYRSGIVFVVDSTLSMGPYIDRTRQAVRRIYEALQAADLGRRVSFGLIGYRDSLAAAPGLGYLAETFATLDEGVDAETFFERVNRVTSATVSSRGFIEDAYAGVKRAIDEIDWSGYDARYVVLITDAGARRADDPLSATGLDAESLRQLALDKGVAVWVLHLLTPQGRRNHASAAEQYRRLSHFPGIGDFHYPVPMGSVDEFGRVLEIVAGQIKDQVSETARGLPPELPPAVAAIEPDPLRQFQAKVAKLGYALRMRYLARAEGVGVPEVFDAWLVDRQFADPVQRSLEVRALLTRDQLSDLQYVLKRVLEAAEEGLLSPRTFLDDLKSLAATISRDPTAAGRSTRAAGESQNLADLGYMREYIEDLPYTGEIMNLSLDVWEQWPAREQLDFLHRLESKVNYYEAVHDNLDLWVSLDGGPISGDSVFPIALSRLP